MRLDRLKYRVYTLLEHTPNHDQAAQSVHSLILIIICLNVLAVILESEKSLRRGFRGHLVQFDRISLILFTVEFLLRLWSCTADPRRKHPVFGRLRFITSPFGIIDLLAIAPFYLPMIFGFDLRVIRLIRLFRTFRIFKIGRYSEAMQTLARVIRSRKEELYVSLCLVALLLVISSSVVYCAEREAQPQVFSSIPKTMWWSIATLTTIGYGDMYPVTPMGRTAGAVTALFGIALFALPTAILGSGFLEELQRKREKMSVCPHCGKAIPVQDE